VETHYPHLEIGHRISPKKRLHSCRREAHGVVPGLHRRLSRRALYIPAPEGT